MLMRTLYGSLILLLVFGAFQAADGMSCRNVEPVKDFDYDKFIGHWYAFAYRYGGYKNVACLQYVYGPSNINNDVPVIRLLKDRSDNSLHMRFAKTFNLARAGVGEHDGLRFTVVGVNYKRFAILIGCDSETDELAVWILTRRPDPPVEGIDGLLRRYKLKLKSLRMVNQKKCPNDWSNAQKEEIDFRYGNVRDILKNFGLVKN